MGSLVHTAIDRRLLKAAARFASPEELSEAVNGQLTPAQAIDRVKTLLASRDIYTDVEQRRLLLLQIADLMQHLQEQAKDANNPAAWAALNRTFKLLSDQIERSSVNVEEISVKLAKAHARNFVEGYALAMQEIFNILEERGMLTLEPDDIKEIASIGVQRGMVYLETVTEEDEEE